MTMSLTDVIGHEQQIEALRHAVAAERLPNAYLFVGPPNLGKTLLAREVAKAVNCERVPDNPSPAEVDSCGECHNCVRIDQTNHPDMEILRPAVRVEVKPPESDAADDDGPRVRDVRRDVFIELPDAVIDTERVGELMRHCSAKPALGKRKIGIICSAEQMNVAAANRLLKTLEEPPPNTTFILTTANPSRLLDTIVSRCQMVKLHPLANSELRRALEERYTDAEPQLREAATAMAGGRFGRASDLLGAPQIISLRDELLDLIAAAPEAALAECLVMGEKLAEMPQRWWAAVEAAEERAGEGSDEQRQMRAEALEELGKKSPDRINRLQMNELLDILQTWHRDLTLLRANPNSPLVINLDRREQLRELAPVYSPDGLVWASEIIEDARRDLLVHNANFALACQVLMVKLIAARRR